MKIGCFFFMPHKQGLRVLNEESPFLIGRRSITILSINRIRNKKRLIECIEVSILLGSCIISCQEANWKKVGCREIGVHGVNVAAFNSRKHLKYN